MWVAYPFHCPFHGFGSLKCDRYDFPGQPLANAMAGARKPMSDAQRMMERNASSSGVSSLRLYSLSRAAASAEPRLLRMEVAKDFAMPAFRAPKTGVKILAWM